MPNGTLSRVNDNTLILLPGRNHIPNVLIPQHAIAVAHVAAYETVEPRLFAYLDFRFAAARIQIRRGRIAFPSEGRNLNYNLFLTVGNASLLLRRARFPVDPPV